MQTLNWQANLNGLRFATELPYVARRIATQAPEIGAQAATRHLKDVPHVFLRFVHFITFHSEFLIACPAAAVI